METARAATWPVVAALLTAVVAWGANNVGLKFVVTQWPPLAAGASRFLIAGAILLALIHATRFFGTPRPLDPILQRQIWLRGGVLLAVYIALCNWTLRWIPASHFALHLAASPIWALLFEDRAHRSAQGFRAWTAAGLTFGGVIVLLWPAFHSKEASWFGEFLGMGCAILWTLYSQQCRVFSRSLTPAQVSAHTMWRAGIILHVPGLIETAWRPIVWRADILAAHAYSILFGGVVAFGCWNYALSHWPPSRVFLIGNLMPLSTMAWAYVWFGEPFTPTFGWSMALIVSGVIIGQGGLHRLLGLKRN